VVRLLWPANTVLQQLTDVGLLIVVLQSTFQLLTYILRARLQAGAYSIFTIWTKGVGLVIGLFLAIYFHLGVLGVLWGTLLGFASAFPFVCKMGFAQVRAIGPVSLPLLRELAQYGVPLVIGNLSGWVLSQCDRYLIQLFYSAREVGMYSAAYWISENS